MRSTLRRGAVVLIGTAAALSVGLGSALADPNLDNQGSSLPGGFLPDTDDLVGVGSDTTMYVTNALAQAYSATNPADGRLVASFNAFQPGSEDNAGGPVTGDPIAIRPGVTIPRPNGSSAGVGELIANDDIDFARSSRGPRDTEGALSFIPFANDGLSYMVDEDSFVPTNLSAADLRDVYTCQLPGFDAKLPQAGSGTRAFFLDAIDVTETEIAQAVAAGCVDDTVQEHDESAVDGNAFALAPISSARFSYNPPDPANPPSSNVWLASEQDAAAFSVNRDVYHVVRDSEVNDPAIQAVFGPTGYICTQMNDPASPIEVTQGFTPSSAPCGVAI